MNKTNNQTQGTVVVKSLLLLLGMLELVHLILLYDQM